MTTAADRLAQIPIGTRVVVRHLIEAGERASDALGELAHRDAESVSVQTRRGPVRIELADVVLAKQVPPAPGRGWRVASFLRRAGVAVLGLDAVLVGATARLVEELRAAGTPVFVLTNGAEPVPHELEAMGLGHLLPGLLNSDELGSAEPAPEVYAAAHAEIERRLGRTVGRAEVYFTDDRPGDVDAARVFGWQARVFTLP